MATLKTQPNDANVAEFINRVEPDTKRKDSIIICDLMEKITGCKPVMWGTSIIGFGDYNYKSSSGREGDWFLTGFSPRKQNLTLYLMGDLKNYESTLKNLGKFKKSVGCLYLKKLEDINIEVLEKLITQAVTALKTKNS